MINEEKNWRPVYKALALILSVIAFSYIGYLFFDIIVMLIISMLLAMIFDPLVTWLEQHKVNRLISVLGVFLLTGFVLFVVFSILIPKIIFQLNELLLSFNKETISALMAQTEAFFAEYLPILNAKDVVQKLTSFFTSFFYEGINNFSTILTSIFTVLAMFVIVPFMTFFLLKDRADLIKGLINFMPNKYFEMSYWVVKKISLHLGKFVRGWIFDAFIVGLLAGIGLSLLGIQNAFTIGFVAGVGHLIPYFGPVIGGLPAIIISLIQFGDFSMFPKITLLFVIIYTFDNGFIQPQVFSKATEMHPLIIILLILIGSQLLGILGMLLAVPAATVIKTATREIYYAYKNYKIIKT